MPRPKLRGARPTPRHVLADASPYRPIHPLISIPTSFGTIPSKLNMWGNDTYGDCVSAEEAAAKAIYSVMGGGPEILISDQEVISWAKQGGYLNGADLTPVMDTMAGDGMIGPDGKTYDDGPYHSVDWTNDAVLSSAIYQGPVKIGVAANQIENAVNTTNDASGWVLTGARRDQNEDHCVCLCGYGTVAELCAMLHVPIPAGAPATNRAYLLFTWQTIGVIDQASLIAICGEAWLRTPTTVGAPVPPAPTPSPVPTPGPAPTPALFTGSFLAGRSGPIGPQPTVSVVAGLITGVQ